MVVKLQRNNLYRNGTIMDIVGNPLLIRDIMDLGEETKDEYKTVDNSDSLTLIAYNAYKNVIPDASKLWWIIADANRIFNPMDLSDWVGSEIVIPDIHNVLIKLQ